MTGVQFTAAGEEERLLEIYQACFPEDGEAFWRWIFDRVYRPENTLVFRENGQITASLQMIPCQMRLGDRVLDAHYIYAASTVPERQGRGLMGRLLELAAEEGRRREQAYSVLITQEDSLQAYYARFGYRPRLLARFEQPQTGAPDTARLCRRAEERDIPALNELYEQAAAGMLHGVRDAAHWRMQLELFGAGAQVLERDGLVAAYAFSNERGVMEAAGPEAAALAAYAAPGEIWRTLPGPQDHPIGCIRPLNQWAGQLMEQTVCFLNLMYN